MCDLQTERRCEYEKDARGDEAEAGHTGGEIKATSHIAAWRLIGID